MKRHILLIVFFLNTLTVSGQSGKASYLGMNLLQLPALTINTNFTSEVKSFLSPLVELGYTLNYTKAVDFMGYILTPHCKCANDGYDISKQSGGYIKIGAFFNLRNDFKKSYYPHLGLFLTNSIVNEEGTYSPLEQSVYMPVEVNHSKYIIGLSASLGYEFSITDRLRSNIDFQVSFPNNNYKNLYGYRNYIPGMGHKDYEGYWFPMVIWNIKYQL
jgi:hypothetical protein